MCPPFQLSVLVSRLKLHEHVALQDDFDFVLRSISLGQTSWQMVSTPKNRQWG